VSGVPSSCLGRRANDSRFLREPFMLHRFSLGLSHKAVLPSVWLSKLTFANERFQRTYGGAFARMHRLVTIYPSPLGGCKHHRLDLEAWRPSASIVLWVTACEPGGLQASALCACFGPSRERNFALSFRILTQRDQEYELQSGARGTSSVLWPYWRRSAPNRCARSRSRIINACVRTP
jgi:hypothetical protein